jgi:hypothetical protein
MELQRKYIARNMESGTEQKSDEDREDGDVCQFGSLSKPQPQTETAETRNQEERSPIIPLLHRPSPRSRIVQTRILEEELIRQDSQLERKVEKWCTKAVTDH